MQERSGILPEGRRRISSRAQAQSAHQRYIPQRCQLWETAPQSKNSLTPSLTSSCLALNQPPLAPPGHVLMSPNLGDVCPGSCGIQPRASGHIAWPWDPSTLGQNRYSTPLMSHLTPFGEHSLMRCHGITPHCFTLSQIAKLSL